MLLIQGEHGADLLAYSESLEDVSFTATSVEVWRSLGYWLMYIRDGYAPTTTAGADYMEAGRPIVLGFVLVVVALVGFAAVQFRSRRYAIVLTFVGVILAAGVHRFGDPSPIARLVRGDGQEGLALALRSSTRALPDDDDRARTRGRCAHRHPAGPNWRQAAQPDPHPRRGRSRGGGGRQQSVARRAQPSSTRRSNVTSIPRRRGTRPQLSSTSCPRGTGCCSCPAPSSGPTRGGTRSTPRCRG